MKRPSRISSGPHKGMYLINGKYYPNLFGSRQQVFKYETAAKTPGGLYKKDLYFNNKTGRIVSLKKHITAKKEQRLKKHGWGTRKGKYGAIRIGPAAKRGTRKTRKTRGGGIAVNDSSKFQSQAAELSNSYKN